MWSTRRVHEGQLNATTSIKIPASEGDETIAGKLQITCLHWGRDVTVSPTAWSSHSRLAASSSMQRSLISRSPVQQNPWMRSCSWSYLPKRGKFLFEYLPRRHLFNQLSSHERVKEGGRERERERCILNYVAYSPGLPQLAESLSSHVAAARVLIGRLLAVTCLCFSRARVTGTCCQIKHSLPFRCRFGRDWLGCSSWKLVDCKLDNDNGKGSWVLVNYWCEVLGVRCPR